MRALLFLIITFTSAFAYGKEKPFNLLIRKEGSIEVFIKYTTLIDKIFKFASENNLKVEVAKSNEGSFGFSFEPVTGLHPYLDCDIFAPEGHTVYRSGGNVYIDIRQGNAEDYKHDYFVDVHSFGLVVFEALPPPEDKRSGVWCHSSFLIETRLAEYLQEFAYQVIEKDVK